MAHAVTAGVYFVLGFDNKFSTYDALQFFDVVLWSGQGGLGYSHVY